jgi:hypothetical protein
MTETIHYESLVESFEDGLLNKLRGHGVEEHEFLEMWVPDPDPVKSVLNMVEAAEIGAVESFDIAISSETLGGPRLDELKDAVAAMATLELEKTDGGHILHLGGIGG